MSRGEKYLDAFLSHSKSGTFPDFAEFLHGRFNNLDTDLAYGLSWILIHYFVNAEDRRLLTPFQEWVMRRMGTRDDPGVCVAIGRSPEQLLSALIQQVAAMKRS